MRTAHLHPWLGRVAATALLCAATGAIAIQAATADGADDATGELIGELIFRADLMSSLDTLCPRGRPAPDWRAALPPLPPEATTPELLDLSRRLGADAGQQLVQETGGCRSVDFAVAYDESRQTFGELIERWRHP
jgi:hypothetical protein